MKKPLLTAILSIAAIIATAQTATNFACNDCLGNSHTLYDELDGGKVIVLCWVMPCGTCTGPSLTAYNIVQSYQSSNPNTVYLYLVDDYANSSCTSLNSWANSIGVSQSSSSLRFSNAAINMTDYGSTGMPKVVVLGGSNHSVFYNANNTVNSAAMQNAVDNALLSAGISTPQTDIASANVFPNPTKDLAVLNLNIGKSTEVQVELFNTQGQSVKNVFSGKLTQGETKLNIDLKGYGSGIYYVKVSDAERSKVLKVVVNH